MKSLLVTKVESCLTTVGQLDVTIEAPCKNPSGSFQEVPQPSVSRRRERGQASCLQPELTQPGAQLRALLIPKLYNTGFPRIISPVNKLNYHFCCQVEKHRYQTLIKNLWQKNPLSTVQEIKSVLNTEGLTH